MPPSAFGNRLMASRFISIFSFFLPLFLLTQSARAVAPDSFNNPYYVFDMTRLRDVDRNNIADIRRKWDETLLVAALQGLVNRDSANLFVNFVQHNGRDVDLFWLETFSSEIHCSDGSIREGWLRHRERREIETLDKLLAVFSNTYCGLVVYDESVPATANVALTIAGVEELLPVRYDPAPDSLYSQLATQGAPVIKRLINADGSPMFTGSGVIPETKLTSTGSAKADAYYWMIEKYLKTGKANPLECGYYIDAYWLRSPVGAVQNNCLVNRDFVVSRRGFFFDLSPWDDETPNDDLSQPLGTDFATFNAIMKAAYERTQGRDCIRVSGFTPWDAKYTNYSDVGGKHDPVATEWRQVELTSNYNGYLDADALGLGAMANASFYQHFSLEEKYTQWKPSAETLANMGLVEKNGRPVDKTFVAVYSGDYDSAAWVYQTVPDFWNDPNRGIIPINWAINPNLADRIAPILDFIRKTKTPNDFFISGDSGAGYVNPMSYVAPRRFSQLPDALDVWIRHCAGYFARWDVSGIGFIIDGDAPDCNRAALERLSIIARDGIVTHRGTVLGVVDNPCGIKTPFCPMNSDLLNLQHAKQVILGDVRFDQGPQFNVYRSILWSPSQLKELEELVKNDPEKGKRIRFVDMYTFWLLIKLEAEYLNKSEFERRL